MALSGLPQEPLVHNLTPTGHVLNMKVIGIALIIVLLGVGTGWFLASKHPAGGSMMVGTSGTADGNSPAKAGQVVGSGDAQTFHDSAEGQLQEGGLNGEGTHHLDRPGGPSQTVYLTSSILDLSKFVGKNVKVWGETHAAKKAGWLMDVGKVEVLQ